MYHSHFFISALAKALHPLLKDGRLCECYSQEKDELTMEFRTADSSTFIIKADLSRGTSIISFPTSISRSRSNSADLFQQLLSQRIEGIEVFENDRLFRIRFTGNLWLCFKMFGQRSNILLHDETRVLAIFNNHLRKDLESIPQLKGNKADDYHWHPDPEELKRRCPGFTPAIREYWQNVSASLSLKAQELNFIEMIQTLSHPENFFICRRDDEVFVSFFALDDVLFQSPDPIEISNQYYRFYWQVNRFLSEKKKAVQLIRQQIIALHQQIQELELPTTAEEKGNQFRLHADILMAYGQKLPAGLEKISLPDFDGSGHVEIKLKKDLSIIENAERLYRKARGWQEDQNRIVKNRELLRKKSLEKQAILKLLEACENLRELRKLIPENVQAANNSDQTTLPFHIQFCMNYEIRIGKNAKANDELLRMSHKDDLWLHARDVPGSHVLVRVKKGISTPQPVINRAAELAAWYSKAGKESLVPVMLTERKYVRKIKGAAPGQVKVEKEKTLLVKPLS